MICIYLQCYLYVLILVGLHIVNLHNIKSSLSILYFYLVMVDRMGIPEHVLGLVGVMYSTSHSKREVLNRIWNILRPWWAQWHVYLFIYCKFWLCCSVYETLEWMNECFFDSQNKFVPVITGDLFVGYNLLEEFGCKTLKCICDEFTTGCISINEVNLKNQYICAAFQCCRNPLIDCFIKMVMHITGLWISTLHLYTFTQFSQCYADDSAATKIKHTLSICCDWLWGAKGWSWYILFIKGTQ